MPDAVTVPAVGVRDRLDRLLSAELERWATVDEGLRHPFEVLRSAVLAGGKRVRPAFCYWAFVGAGGDPGSARR